ncbi:hypothetical protein B566_EDAN001598, partial [Ephemera danica]
IVRNKAAEKAKHVHHQQQAQQGGGGGSGGGSAAPQTISVITHAPATGPSPHDTALQQQQQQQQQQRPGSYSINGILGIAQAEHLQAPSKRKRDEPVIADENRDMNGHAEEDIKRHRTQYNGDQLYSNLWSSKLLDLGQSGGSGGGGGGSPYSVQSFVSDAQAVAFPASTTAAASSAGDLYDTISTMAQSAPAYSTPLAASLEGSTYSTSGVGTSSPLMAGGGGHISPGVPMSVANSTPNPPQAPTHVGSGVAPGTEYAAYSSTYSQYASSYGSYGYGAGGLLTSPYLLGELGNGNRNGGDMTFDALSGMQQQQQQLQQQQQQVIHHHLQQQHTARQNSEARSPLAATRANFGSLSASSPTASAGGLGSC